MNDTTMTDPSTSAFVEETLKQLACEIEIAFPTNLQAEQALKVLQVDAEPTNRVTKSFRLLEVNDIVALVVRFESKELKMLRVAVSSFYDMVNVVAKTMQEFDPTMRMATTEKE